MCSALPVTTSIDSLPTGRGALRALALKAIAERDAVMQERDVLIAERDKLQGLYEHVRDLLRKANDARFGASMLAIKIGRCQAADSSANYH